MSIAKRGWRRFDGIEVVLIALLIGALTWAAAREYYSVPQEAKALRKVYGKAHYSQFDEEVLIRQFFGDRRNGFFVDVGAHHYRNYSNTYFLERELAWSGIAIDANNEFAAGYAQHRPRTRFRSFFVSERTDEHVKFWIQGKDALLSSFDPELADGPTESRQIPTITLDDLLARERVEQIDFLSIDIELAEPSALAGFSIGTYMPALVCIEAHLPVRQAILDYFASRDYVLVGRYLRADERNLYFMPRARQ